MFRDILQKSAEISVLIRYLRQIRLRRTIFSSSFVHFEAKAEQKSSRKITKIEATAFMLSCYQILILSYIHTFIFSYSHTLILSYSHTLILCYSHTFILSCFHILVLSYSLPLLLSYSHALNRRRAREARE